jgi:zinc/manganese transport system permease protein
VLLVFALMVGPAAAALQFTAHLGRGVAVSVLLALLETWGGIALAYFTDLPTTFWIVFLSCLVYFASLIVRGLRT